MNSYVNDFNSTVKTYYKNLKDFQPLSKEEERELLIKAKEGDIDAQNKVLTANLKYVFQVAKKYKGYGVALEDLISEGNMGLITAYEKFDITYDVKFFTYATHWISYYIESFLNKRQDANNNEISDDELYEPIIDTKKIDDDEDEVIVYEESIMSSQDDELNSDNHEEAKYLTTKLLGKLDSRTQYIIKSYFGINCKESKLEDISKVFNISCERCRQIKNEGLIKMRSELLLSLA